MNSGDDVRSGGKIVKKRRLATGKTPYDRPEPPQEEEEEKEEKGNWIKYVTGGASRLVSSIWSYKKWADFQEPQEDNDSDSEGGIEDDMVDNENHPDGGAELNQNKGSSSGKSEILYLVEQLLTLEHYSREECDRLIEIMNSRVADYSLKEGGDDGQKGPYTRRRAIMEARKVITENVVGSSSKSELDNGNHGSKSLLTPNPQREHFSGGSWNIENEIQRLRSKAEEAKKPDKPKSIEAPKSDDRIVDLASEDVKTTQDDAPTEALSYLPTIEEQNQMSEEKEKDVDDEFTEVPDVIASQGSSNTSDPKKPDSPTPKPPGTRNRSSNTSDPKKRDIPTPKQAGTRNRRFSRRVRGRGK